LRLAKQLQLHWAEPSTAVERQAMYTRVNCGTPFGNETWV
jgi:hypothetical protein